MLPQNVMTLEVWAPGEEQWLEVSSCSNFEDFQSRRGNIRFRDDNGKVDYLHTLEWFGPCNSKNFCCTIRNTSK